MTTEEKIKQCLNKNKTIREMPSLIQAIIGEEIMALMEWKNQQFKEYLESLKNAYIKDSNNLFNRGLTMASEHYNSQIECINQIINNFFKEK